MKAGILAAGRGERLLRAAPLKPLAKVGGRALIEHVLHSFADAGAIEVTIIINADSSAVRDFVEGRNWPFALRWIVESTPTSMHSFLRLVETLAAGGDDGPFLLSTVDTVAGPQTYRRFFAAAQASAADVTLALTAPGDDEKPLLVRLEDARVSAIGKEAAGSAHATAGIYAVRASVLREATASAGLGALREFLGRLHTRGYRLEGIPIEPTIDVDRPADLETAARFFSRRLVGIYREPEYSPGRHLSNDAILLDQIAARLENVELRQIEELPEQPAAALIFSMCQGRAALERLAEWERAGARIVNRPEAARNTHRDRLPGLLRAAGLPFPRTELVETRGQHSLGEIGAGLWLKRGDVHASVAADVQWLDSAERVEAGLEDFARRGIERAVLQEHRAGDEVKFYGVGPGEFFHWFYSREAAGHPLDERALAELAARAATVCGLEIFGGDMIIGPDGELTLIDLNDWPSFAPCREAASAAIAQHLRRRTHHVA